MKILISSSSLGPSDLAQLLQAIRDCEQFHFREKDIFISVEAPELSCETVEHILLQIRPPFAQTTVLKKE